MIDQLIKTIKQYLNKIIHNYNIMQEGTVKFFDDAKGFGFISSEKGRDDIFVHNTGLVDNIREHDVVTFEVERGQRGLNAVNVRLKK